MSTTRMILFNHCDLNLANKGTRLLLKTFSAQLEEAIDGKLVKRVELIENLYHDGSKEAGL